MRKSKMARHFNTEEVLEQVCINHNSQMQPDSMVKNKENDTEKKLSDCLANFEGRETFNGTLFVKTAAKLLLPLVNVCETSVKNTPDMETLDISKIMVSSSINLAVIYKSESQLWLKRIYRRLAGKTNIRRPYYSEIQRDMPVEMFLSLCRLLCNFPEFREPYFYNVGNKKAKVISFTHLPLVKYFLSRLSGKSVEEVAEYFERTLCAQRKGHITKVIVSPVKDFSLVYNFRKGQLTVSYNYGEWNSFGFPQHNCLL